jgi:tripartite-type tricarboxylate transporter receptor subunit TctC
MDRVLLQMSSRIAAIATALLLTASPAIAQTYPHKPIRVVLPFPPGGGTDSLARVILPRMGQALGQSLVIDNRPGAGGTLAAEIVARSAPDGYTLFMGSSTGVTAAPSLYKLAYDPIRDFAAITQFATASFILVVHPSLRAATVSELVALAKGKPDSLRYASGGIGSPLHLAAELFKSRAGVDIVHVPYKGGAAAARSVLAGEAHMIFGSVAASLPHVQAGRLRALAVTGLARVPLLPELPTMVESGFPGFNVQAWNSLEAPAGTPRAVIRRLHGEMIKVLRMPDVAAPMSKIGYAPTETTPEQYASIKRTESAMWAKLIKDANIRPE